VDERIKVIAVRMGTDGEVEKLKLSDGRIVTRDEAVSLCEAGELPDYHAQSSRYGTMFVASNRNLDRSDNLQNLPEF
jgi:hypothetical protein